MGSSAAPSRPLGPLLRRRRRRPRRRHWYLPGVVHLGRRLAPVQARSEMPIGPPSRCPFTLFLATPCTSVSHLSRGTSAAGADAGEEHSVSGTLEPPLLAFSTVLLVSARRSLSRVPAPRAAAMPRALVGAGEEHSARKALCCPFVPFLAAPCTSLSHPWRRQRQSCWFR